MLLLYMSPERLVLDINETFRTINSEDTAKTQMFKIGRSPNAISWKLVWVDRNIVLTVSTTDILF